MPDLPRLRCSVRWSRRRCGSTRRRGSSTGRRCDDIIARRLCHPTRCQRLVQSLGGAPGPRHWEAPDEFRPERFAPGWVPPRGAYLPFGDGPRICIGNRFAEAEIRLVLATLLSGVDLSLVDGLLVRPEGDATLRPRGGLRMRVRRR